MDVIPNENLPAGSMPWGKDMSRWRQGINTRLDRNETDTGNSLKQLNSSVQLLSNQVRDVLGRYDDVFTTVPYPNILFTGNYGSKTGSIQQNGGWWNATETVILQDPRYISTMAVAGVYIGPYTEYESDLYVDGILLDQNHPSLVDGTIPGWGNGYVAGDNGGGPANTYPTLNSVAVASFTLKAGTHTIEYRYWTRGSNASSYFSMNVITFRLSVLGIVNS